MKDKKALVLTIIQYTTLPLMMWQMKWFSENLYLLLIEIIGFVVAAWGIYEMKKSEMNISPIPKEGAFLVRTGIYSVIRHPMYTSLFLIFTPILISDYSTFNLIVYLIFVINLFFKMKYEEHLLNQFFSEYKDYSKTTNRFLPFIY